MSVVGLRELRQRASAISAATLAELPSASWSPPILRCARSGLRRLSVLQRQFDALPVDDAVAASYGQPAAAVVAAGRRPQARVMDLIIAATAHAHSARLYTRNPEDLRGADDLVEVVAV